MAGTDDDGPKDPFYCPPDYLFDYDLCECLSTTPCFIPCPPPSQPNPIKCGECLDPEFFESLFDTGLDDQCQPIEAGEGSDNDGEGSGNEAGIDIDDGSDDESDDDDSDSDEDSDSDDDSDDDDSDDADSSDDSSDDGSECNDINFGCGSKVNIFNFYGSLYGDVNGFDDDDDNVNGLSDIDNDEDCEKENQW